MHYKKMKAEVNPFFPICTATIYKIYKATVTKYPFPRKLFCLNA